jgi:hypothetical protein
MERKKEKVKGRVKDREIYLSQSPQSTQRKSNNSTNRPEISIGVDLGTDG